MFKCFKLFIVYKSILFIEDIWKQHVEQSALQEEYTYNIACMLKVTYMQYCHYINNTRLLPNPQISCCFETQHNPYLSFKT